jgi:hypothetical protein
MSKLQLTARPWVAFDVKNSQHRKWLAEFVQSGRWGDCPVRFALADEPGDILAIQRLVLEYYMKKEFPNRKKPLTTAPKGVIIDTSTTH